jgi:hypothetical protein
MDAAERRMQTGGFGGFSFWEIAEDVGDKSQASTIISPRRKTSPRLW